MADQVQKAAEVVKDTYRYVGESAKPYVGETIGNAVTATGEYGAAGIQKVGEMAGLKSGKGPAERDQEKAKEAVLDTKDYLKDKTYEATDKTKDRMDPDTHQGTGSRGTNQESVSDLLNRYTDKAKSEVNAATADPGKYAQQTFDSAAQKTESALDTAGDKLQSNTGSSTGPGHTGYGSSTGKGSGQTGYGAKSAGI